LRARVGEHGLDFALLSAFPAKNAEVLCTAPEDDLDDEQGLEPETERRGVAVVDEALTRMVILRTLAGFLGMDFFRAVLFVVASTPATAAAAALRTKTPLRLALRAPVLLGNGFLERLHGLLESSSCWFSLCALAPVPAFLFTFSFSFSCGPAVAVSRLASSPPLPPSWSKSLPSLAWVLLSCLAWAV